MHVSKFVSGLNNEGFCPNSSSVNEASKAAFHCVSGSPPSAGPSFHFPDGMSLKFLVISCKSSLVLSLRQTAMPLTGGKYRVPVTIKSNVDVSSAPFYLTSPWNRNREEEEEELQSRRLTRSYVHSTMLLDAQDRGAEP